MSKEHTTASESERVQEPSRPKGLGCFSWVTFWILLGTVLLVAALAALFASRIPSGFKDPSKMPKPVTLQTLQPEAVEVRYQTQGTIEANRRVDLNAERTGTISAILVSEGSWVKRGQVLIRLKGNKERAQRRESVASVSSSHRQIAVKQAGVARAEADVSAVRAQHSLATSEFQRFQTLFDQDFISRLELEQKQSALDNLSAKVTAAETALQQMKADVDQAKSRVGEARARDDFNQAVLSEMVVRAPFSGQVGQKYVDLGDHVLPSEKLLTLVDNSRVKVVFSLPARYSTAMTVRQHLNVRVPGVTTSIPAKITFIDPTVEAESRTITEKAVLDSRLVSGKPLRDGQFVEVSVVLAVRADGLVVPEEALVLQGEKFFVYRAVYTDSKKEQGKAPSENQDIKENTPKLVAEMTEVKLGERGAGWVELTDGVKAGERIVVSGLAKLFDGAFLAPKPSLIEGRRDSLNSKALNLPDETLKAE